jgi:glycosyltransferase involved in cell wall biosynthesis
MKAAAALALRRYDVVHTLTPVSALAGRLTAQTTVFTPLGTPTREDFAEQPAYFQHSFLLAGRLSSALTGLSDAAARRVADLTGRQTHALYPGVRLDRFSPNLEPRLGPPRILFASDASEPRKGLHVLVAAFGTIREQWPDARLQLCGPGNHSWVLDGLGDRASPALAALDPLAVKGLGPMAEETMKAVDVLGVGDHDGLAAQYRQATVTVLPSFNEAFGLVLIESLACGTPVVCSGDGGMTEIVDSPAIGRSVPYGDVDALAQAIGAAIELARDPRTPSRAVDHAHRWGWQESAGPAHEAFYEYVLSQTR